MTKKVGMIEPPFVFNSFEGYKTILAQGEDRVLPASRELLLMHPFYAGFVEGLNLAASLEKSPQRKQAEAILKEELEQYKKAYA